MSKPARLVILVLALVVIGAAISWWLGRRHVASELALYGNVDLRQVDLPFNGSERIAAVLVQEGDHVKKEQLLARLETSRLAPQVARAEADLAAQQHAVATGRRKSHRPVPMCRRPLPTPGTPPRNGRGCAPCPRAPRAAR